MSSPVVRKEILILVDEAKSSGATMKGISSTVGYSTRTLNRWRSSQVDQRTQRDDFIPANKLSDNERENLIKVANNEEYKNLSPQQIVPKLADKGVYLASESTFYRVLRENRQLKHRHKAKPSTRAKPTPLVATKPNEVYSWDITYLPSTIKGIFFYLYLFMDIYSRKIVGWQVYATQSSSLASEIIKDIAINENIQADKVTLHSDNGSPMKGATFLSTLQMLGIMPTFSRPSVSDDNPYSESLFRTLKYSNTYPSKPFDSVVDARVWTTEFVEWYNNTHCHSSIEFVTPNQRHQGKDRDILQARKILYEESKSKNPLRWSGSTRRWVFIKKVYLNPNKERVNTTEDILTSKLHSS